MRSCAACGVSGDDAPLITGPCECESPGCDGTLTLCVDVDACSARVYDLYGTAS
jgi:hypothetical protein